MNKTNQIKGLALFMICLVLTLPFYSANVYASLQVVQNSGQDNIDGFFKANQDIWSLIVRVADQGNITADEITVNNQPFASCSSSTPGSFLCTYQLEVNQHLEECSISPCLSFMPEDRHELDIRAQQESLTTHITADGSPPQVTNLNALQQGPIINVSFYVEDKPDNCVGLDEIIIKEDGQTLTTISDLSGCQRQSFSRSVGQSLTGSRNTFLEIQVRDKLGHSRTHQSNSFFLDKTPPQIIIDSLTFGESQEYARSGAHTTDVSLTVIEDGDALSVTSSLGAASCVKTVGNEFICTWPNKQVDFSSSLSLQVSAYDGFNQVTRTLTKSFTIDDEAPLATFFGTSTTYNNINLAKPEDNEIKIVFEENAGLNPEKVYANLRALSSTLTNYEQADNCSQEGSAWTCYWYNIDVDSSGEIYLVEAEDKVGNFMRAPLPSASIELDDTAPAISDISVRALGSGGELRDYFQSRDMLKIDFSIFEPHGFSAYVNLSDVINGASLEKASCQEKMNNIYDCSLTTERIKSGYDKSSLEIVAEDTSGNKETRPTEIEILGLDVETNPDFWSVGAIQRRPASIVKEALEVGVARAFFYIPLKTTQSGVTLISADIEQCESNGVSNGFVINNNYGSDTPVVVLEYSASPDIEELTAECNLIIYSQKGNTVMANSEEETLQLNIPVIKSKLSDIPEKLDEEIADAREEAESGLWGLIGLLNTIVKWAQFLCNIIDVINTVIQAYQVIQTGLDSLYVIPLTRAGATAECISNDRAVQAAQTSGIFLDKFCKILSCRAPLFSDRPSTKEQVKSIRGNREGFARFFGEEHYQQFGLNPSPYDNIILAFSNVCLPAIIYNLDKYRQIKCHYVYCLENYAKEGVASIEACRELKDYEECKYWWGELFQLIPFISPLSMFFEKIKNVLTDPIGLIRLIFVRVCAEKCAISGSIAGLCQWSNWVVFWLDFIQDIMAIESGYKQLSGDYCSLIKEDGEGGGLLG